jgi:hypothetical protein
MYEIISAAQIHQDGLLLLVSNMLLGLLLSLIAMVTHQMHRRVKVSSSA